MKFTGILLLIVMLVAPAYPSYSEECSTFLWREPASSGEFDLYLAKNRDRGTWEKDRDTHRQQHQEVVVKPCFRNGHTLTGIQTRRGGVTMGINTLGLTAVINMSPYRTHFRPETAAEWADHIQRLKGAGAFRCQVDGYKANAESLLQKYSRVTDILADVRRGRLFAHKIITVADVTGDGAVIEFVTLAPPRKSKLPRSIWAAWRRFPPGSGREILQTTNHYRIPSFIPFNEGEGPLTTTYRRGDRLATRLDHCRSMNLTEAIDVLRDHHDFPFFSICSHKDLSREPVSPTRAKTISAAVYHCSSRTRKFTGWWCIGNPCLGGFTPISVGEPVPPFLGEGGQDQRNLPVNAAALFSEIYRQFPKDSADASAVQRLARLSERYTRLRIAADRGRARPADGARRRALEALLCNSTAASNDEVCPDEECGE